MRLSIHSHDSINPMIDKNLSGTPSNEYLYYFNGYLYYFNNTYYRPQALEYHIFAFRFDRIVPFYQNRVVREVVLSRLLL